MDSGEEEDEAIDVVSDGRRASGWFTPKSATPLKPGFHSMVQRAREEP